MLDNYYKNNYKNHHIKYHIKHNSNYFAYIKNDFIFNLKIKLYVNIHIINK